MIDIDMNLIQWGCGIGAVVASASFLKFYPKAKLQLGFDAFMYKVGKVISLLGNSKIGRKAMDTLEEGPIATLITVGVSGFLSLGKGLVSDYADREVKP